MIIAVDFDGTIVDHRYPDIGAEVPGAVEWLKRLVERGAKLILLTMRSGETLRQAVRWCDDKGISLWAANRNPQQWSWTRSVKVYAHAYVDDAGFGCPLHENPRMGGRPYVDWNIVGPGLMKMLEAHEQ